jgi:hypothetical protein
VSTEKNHEIESGGASMSEFNVCSNAALNAKANSGETLKNENSNSVTLAEDPNNPDSWPFAYPSSPFTINGKVGSDPGIQGVVLITTPGTYYYNTSGCPGGLTADTNPKTVIIT